MAKIKCPNCHKWISDRSPINHNKRKFCNRKCYNAWLKKHRKPKEKKEKKIRYPSLLYMKLDNRERKFKAKLEKETPP